VKNARTSYKIASMATLLLTPETTRRAVTVAEVMGVFTDCREGDDTENNAISRVLGPFYIHYRKLIHTLMWLRKFPVDPFCP